jgi:adenylosuccinate synthase
VYGLVTSSSWNGNEAIDFIYTPGQGKMSVKVFEKGKWIDKSETGNYEIKWELEEIDTNDIQDFKNTQEQSMQDISESVKKNNSKEKVITSVNIIKEVIKEDENKLIEIVENPYLDKDIGDFPIIDRLNEIHEENNNN